MIGNNGNLFFYTCILFLIGILAFCIIDKSALLRANFREQLISFCQENSSKPSSYKRFKAHKLRALNYLKLVSSEWGLFTLPNIFFKKSSNSLICVSPFEEKYDLGHLNLCLQNAKQKPYPIQLRGWSHGSHNEAHLLLYSLETHNQLIANVGDYVDGFKITIRSFKMTEKHRDGMYYIVPEIEIFDHSRKASKTLTSELCYSDRYEFVFKSESSTNEYYLKDQNEILAIDNMKYKIDYFDPITNEIVFQKADNSNFKHKFASKQEKQ